MRLVIPVAVEVGRHILHLANTKDRKGLTPMQILKLVYISHGWTLGIHDQPLFGEPVEVWKYGPVVRSVYQWFGRYRGSVVDAETESVRNSGRTWRSEEKDIMAQVFDEYGAWDGWTLSGVTHKEGSPWWQARQAGLKTIPDSMTREYYDQLSRQTTDRARIGGA